ncbi:MAG: hypothetical protein JWQ97_4028 [Phenylobacterium sp.]|nr:hypothetical protein [Phenylobacterium sp.]
MKLHFTAAFAALAAVALATSAMASEPVVAKLAVAGKGAVKPVAGGAVFECLGDVCAARTPGADTASVRGCKELVRQVGAVSAFGPTSKQLSTEQLASCNESAKK